MKAVLYAFAVIFLPVIVVVYLLFLLFRGTADLVGAVAGRPGETFQEMLDRQARTDDFMVYGFIFTVLVIFLLAFWFGNPGS